MRVAGSQVNITVDSNVRQMTFNLSHGYYRTQVCGMNIAGISTCSPYDHFMLDNTPPVFGDICVSGVGAPYSHAHCSSANDTASTAYLNALYVAHHARWVVHDHASGINFCRWAIGSSAGLDDVSSWVDVLWADEVRLPDVSAHSSPYLNIYCTDRAGWVSNASRALVYDDSPPVVAAGALCFGGVQCVTSSTGLVAAQAYCLKASAICYVNSTSVGVVVNRHDINDAQSGIAGLAHYVLPNDAANGSVALPADGSSITYFEAVPGVAYRVELRAHNHAQVDGVVTRT